MDLGATCGSMILPDEDVIELFASAQGMKSLKGTLDVVVEVPGASAYALSGAAKHTLTPSASTFGIKLVPSGKMSVKTADNTLVVKAANGAVLASIVLGGARDLLSSKARDGVDKRDAFLLQTWLHNVETPIQGPLLVAGPYYAPKAGVFLDGKWGEIQNAAFKRFAADRGASSWTDAVRKLRDAARQHASAGPWFPQAS
jgi:hypothetical protein